MSVKTNDPGHPWLRLRVSGKVRSYVTVEPDRVNLGGRAGEEIARQVKIVPETDEPFSILDVRPVRGDNIECSLEESDDSGRKGYILHVKNLRQEPGRYYDSIHLETDSDFMKKITIAVSGNIRPAQ